MRTKVRQGEQNVPTRYLRGERYYPNTHLQSLPKQARSFTTHSFTQSRINWACSDVHTPRIRTGRPIKEPLLYRYDAYPWLM